MTQPTFTKIDDKVRIDFMYIFAKHLTHQFVKERAIGKDVSIWLQENTNAIFDSTHPQFVSVFISAEDAAVFKLKFGYE